MKYFFKNLKPNNTSNNLILPNSLNKIDKIVLDDAFNIILINYIKQRSVDISLTYDLEKINDTLKIKLFGNDTSFIKNSKWVNINEDLSMSPNLEIQKDLLFSKADMYFIIEDFMTFFEIEIDNNQSLNIMNMITSKEIIFLKDLKTILNELLNINLI